MVVTPTLAKVGGDTLTYTIEIRNTGAYTATGVVLSDTIPTGTTYNGGAKASDGSLLSFANGALQWTGNVGFDSLVSIQFSVQILPTYNGTVHNVASINHPSFSQPVLIEAYTVVTDQPILAISKSSSPEKIGPNQPLIYEINVTNQGQTGNLSLTVTDTVPKNATFLASVGGGSYDKKKNLVTWTRDLNLPTGASSIFTFTVQVNDVPSGTMITNDQYGVRSLETGLTAGQPYTVTVTGPVFLIDKKILPDPPGSNGTATYELTLLNQGSRSTDIIVTDRVPGGVTYSSGGDSFTNGVVTWNLDQLDTGETAVFSYTVSIGDVMGVPIVNSDYKACSAEDVCQAGLPLSSLIQGPNFALSGWLDPIAKKPGGGTGPVTPTLVIENLGPGSALDATATLFFKRISVSQNDLVSIPRGKFSPGPTCGDKCLTYLWNGDIYAGETITITTIEGQNSIGGDEGTVYSATITISDTLGITSTAPISATALGHVTHFSNLIPTKTAPPVIGAGQNMTYTISVFNSGLSTDVPPYPVLTDTLPLNTTLVSISDGGTSQTTGGGTVISWALPAMSPGDVVNRSFEVQVDPDLISGTQIINSNYGTSWFNLSATGVLSNTGESITTTVREVGLIDSFKTVEPEHLLPGPGGVFTYVLHIINSGPLSLGNVQVNDTLPWEHSTYQRDAIATSGDIISDVVNLNWNGSVAPYSTELITYTVLVDDGYSGPLTNTAVITQPNLLEPVPIEAIGYVTDKPVLKIWKTANLPEVKAGGELLYTLTVENLGEIATGLVVTDPLPVNTEYVTNSATASGQLTGNGLSWQIPFLQPGDQRALLFRVRVTGGQEVTNQDYQVTCKEGVSTTGSPIVTPVDSGNRILLPLVTRP
jgi:uncharacterized repeat protein (TIGR01451 family)